jgi:hypothetical protein
MILSVAPECQYASTQSRDMWLCTSNQCFLQHRSIYLSQMQTWHSRCMPIGIPTDVLATLNKGQDQMSTQTRFRMHLSTHRTKSILRITWTHNAYLPYSLHVYDNI